MNRLSGAPFALAVVLLLGAAPVARAQVAPRAPAAPVPAAAPPVATFQETPDIRDTYQRLQEILRGHPPSVRQVLQLDPSLLASPDYMAPYPQLAAFLQQHPEIQRNPGYFFGRSDDRDRDPRERAIDAFSAILAGMALFAGVMAALFVIASLLRQLIDYRRWLRQVRIQTDIHTKLLDRLATNEDLLGYIQSPAGRRFLESAPIAIESDPRTTLAPFGRILWAVQAGVILASLGVGLWLVQGSVVAELAPGFSAIGTVVFVVGVGFVISAALSYLLSARLGLFTPRPQHE